MNDFQEKFTPTGGMHTSNTGGIEVELHPDGDALRYRFVYGQPDIDDEPVIEAEIVYEPDEDEPEGELLAGFYIEEDFYPLSNFLRYDNRG